MLRATLNESNKLPSNSEYPELLRATSSYIPHDDYTLAKGDLKHYQQQYGDIYFLRLAQLKPIVEEIAAEAWEGYQVGTALNNIMISPADGSQDSRRHGSSS